MAIADQHRRDALVHHFPGGVTDRRVRPDADRPPGHEVLNGLAARAAKCRGRRLRRQAIGESAYEQGVEFDVLLAGLGERLCAQVIDQRVLERDRVVARGRVVHQRRKAETIALGEARHHFLFFVTQFDGAGADDVQAVVWPADRQDIVALAVVLDVDVARAFREQRVVERVEARQLAQEIDDIRDFTHTGILTRPAK